MRPPATAGVVYTNSASLFVDTPSYLSGVARKTVVVPSSLVAKRRPSPSTTELR